MRIALDEACETSSMRLVSRAGSNRKKTIHDWLSQVAATHWPSVDWGHAARYTKPTAISVVANRYASHLTPYRTCLCTYPPTIHRWSWKWRDRILGTT